MLKKIIFIFSLFIVVKSFSQTITATQKIPATATPGSDYVVEITINKVGVAGFMKFFQEVPTGCTAVAIESKNGNFSFADGGAKIIWIAPPAEDVFTISYKVTVPSEVSGIKTINGKIAYLDKNERKSFDLQTETINITDKTEATIASNNETVTPPAPPTPEKVTETFDSKKEEVEETPVIETQEVKEEVIATIEEKKTPPPVIQPESVPVKKEEISIPAPVVTKKKEIEKTPSLNNMPVGANVPATAIPSTSGKTFRVQIGAFTLKPTIKGVPEPSKVLLDNGMTKYFSGNFTTYEAATKRKKALIEKGFQGAFIVSFENGKIVR